MSQVLSVLERHNLSVEVSDEGRSIALIQGQSISFGIEEPIRKVVTQTPRVANPTDRWDYDEIVKNEPSGLLALVIHSEAWETRGLQTKWRDAKVQRIENLIPDFVAGLMRTAVVLRQKEEERKRRELEEQKRAQNLAQLRKDIEEEEQRGPHSLRHACATRLLKKGTSLREIADFLGHRNLRTVSIYAKLDTRSLRKVASFSMAGVL